MRFSSTYHLGGAFLLQSQSVWAAFATSLSDASRGPGGFLGARRAFTRGNTALQETTTETGSSAKEPTFPTWSFDKHCTAMEWNDVVPATMGLPDDNSVSAVSASGADLTLVGIRVPPKDEGEGGEEDDEEMEQKKDDDDELPIILTGWAQALDETVLNGAMKDVLAETVKTFKNGVKVGSTSPTLRSTTSKRYIAMGLGPSPKLKAAAGEGDAESIKAKGTNSGMLLGKTLATKCNEEKKVKACNVILPVTLVANATTMQDFATGFYQTLYQDNRYRSARPKKQPPAKDLAAVTIFAEPDESGAAVDPEAITTALERGRRLARGVIMTKDIVNAPHNVLNSESLAETAQRIAAQSDGRLECTILDKVACEERGMGAYLGVARGSETKPQFIHLTYKPPSGEVNAKVGVVGKGLLFDTGGYNIKTSMMEGMKYDCGGAAAVLGAARAIAAMEIPGVEVHFVVAACENMISHRAYVPSDILTASNGKTIEVLNTDAEGRLTLADALVYADKELGCEKIVELSTLTGACMVALGLDIAGVWTRNDELANELAEISKITGDKSWRMPMAKEYNELLESKFADMKNIGTRYGGSITAALFLQKFVSTKKPFAHIDIAGPVWKEKTGATGYGAKLVTEWVRRQGASSPAESSE